MQPGRPTILKRVVREDLTGKVIFDSSSEGDEGVGHAGIISWKSSLGREISKNKVHELGARLTFKKQLRRICVAGEEVNEGKCSRIRSQRNHKGK